MAALDFDRSRNVVVLTDDAKRFDYELREEDVEMYDHQKKEWVYKLPPQGGLLTSLFVDGLGISKAMLYQQKDSILFLDEIFTRGAIEPCLLSGLPMNDCMYLKVIGETVSVVATFVDLDDTSIDLLADTRVVMHTSHPSGVKYLELTDDGYLKTTHV